MQGGGGISFSEANPWWERAEAREMDRPYGFSMGTGAGRNDKNNASVASGSYVLPADVIAGLGEGNSLAGAKVWDTIHRSMPFGIAPPPAHRGRGPPAPPHGLQPPGEGGVSEPPIKPGLASGGKAEKEGEDHDVPVVTADGEVLLSPDDVRLIGRAYSDPTKHKNDKAMLAHGQSVLDEFVREVRGRVIKHLASLPGPRGSKNPELGHAETA